MADIQPPAPLGWCAHCLVAGEHVQAVTLLDGTAVCSTHAEPLLLKTRHD